MAGFKDLIDPMTLGNMRANGVRSLAVSCWQMPVPGVRPAPSLSRNRAPPDS
jgi:hypothetical protein